MARRLFRTRPGSRDNRGRRAPIEPNLAVAKGFAATCDRTPALARIESRKIP